MSRFDVHPSICDVWKDDNFLIFDSLVKEYEFVSSNEEKWGNLMNAMTVMVPYSRSNLFYILGMVGSLKPLTFEHMIPDHDTVDKDKRHYVFRMTWDISLFNKNYDDNSITD